MDVTIKVELLNLCTQVKVYIYTYVYVREIWCNFHSFDNSLVKRSFNCSVRVKPYTLGLLLKCELMTVTSVAVFRNSNKNKKRK